MIRINDMFRLQKLDPRSGYVRWWIEEWTPTQNIEGRWERYTKLMHAKHMDQVLERMQCPAGPHTQFREEAGL